MRLPSRGIGAAVEVPATEWLVRLESPKILNEFNLETSNSASLRSWAVFHKISYQNPDQNAVDNCTKMQFVCS